MSFSHGDTGQSGPLNRPKGPQRPGCVTALGPLAPCHVCAHLPRKPREATPPRGQLRPSGGPGKRGVRPAGPKRTSWDEERRESISRHGQFCSVVACSPVGPGTPVSQPLWKMHTLRFPDDTRCRALFHALICSPYIFSGERFV